MIRLPAEGRSARSSPPGGLPEGFDAITELVLVVVDVVTVIFASRSAELERTEHASADPPSVRASADGGVKMVFARPPA